MSATSVETMWHEAERRRLVRLCAAVSGDRNVAEDLAQETLLEAWRHRHKLTDPSGADRWLSAVARNVCLRFLRRQSTRELPVAEVPEASIVAAVDPGACGDPVPEALALLSASTREVLLWRHVHELTVGEIAAHLGISEDAVSMRLTRARSAARRALAGADWSETQLWCRVCGAGRLSMRRAGSSLAFRCGVCDPDGCTAMLPLDNPSFARLVGSLRRPSAILGRIADWTLDYWTQGEGHVAACTRCGGDVTVRAHIRTDTPRAVHGLFVRCAGCGEELWSSLVGIATAAPEIRAFRRRNPRTSATVRETREAVIVDVGEHSVGFDGRSFRLLGRA